MMKDDQPDDTRPVKIVAGLALLVLFGAWLVTSIKEPASLDPPAEAESTADAGAASSPAGGTQRNQQEMPAAAQDAQNPQGSDAADQQRAQGALRAESADTNVSPQVARTLTNVIELLNADKFDEARAALDPLLTADAMAQMTPFEISRLYQLSFNLNMQDESYEAAQADLQAAIESGGLNAQEMSQMQYQRAQLFVQMEDYAKAADSLELWIAEQDAAQNQGAYYLLAASYYYQEKFDDARDHMETLFTLPGEKQEGWYQMMSSLYLQNQDYAKAIPVTKKMVELYGDERYQEQLAALYVQTRDYAAARPVVEKLVELNDNDQHRMQLNFLNQMDKEAR